MLVAQSKFIFTLGLFIGSIFLQFYLSKQSNKWLGLVLPITTFSYSLLRLFIVISIFDGASKADIGMAITLFLTFNIPTIVMLTIYFVLRKKVNQDSELGKMNIQDLE